MNINLLAYVSKYVPREYMWIDLSFDGALATWRNMYQ